MLVKDCGFRSPAILTSRNVFTTCGKLVRHFLVYGLLCAATGVKKRGAAVVTKGWNDTVYNIPIKLMMAKVIPKCTEMIPPKVAGA